METRRLEKDLVYSAYTGRRSFASWSRSRRLFRFYSYAPCPSHSPPWQYFLHPCLKVYTPSLLRQTPLPHSNTQVQYSPPSSDFTHCERSFVWLAYVSPRKDIVIPGKLSTELDMIHLCGLQPTKFHEFPAAEWLTHSCRGPNVVLRVCCRENGSCQDQKSDEDAQSSKHCARAPDQDRTQ